MPEPVESAIEIALLSEAAAFATAQGLDIAMPNGAGTDGRPFSPPNSTPSQQWLRATVIPAPTTTAGIAFDSNFQHMGYLQIDVLQGYGGGTAAMKRVVSAIAEYFPFGMTITQDGFDIKVIPISTKQVVSQGPLMDDGAGFMKVPVSIPYLCFAKPA
jgi:hypothetical protein